MMNTTPGKREKPKLKRVRTYMPESMYIKLIELKILNEKSLEQEVTQILTERNELIGQYYNKRPHEVNARIPEGLHKELKDISIKFNAPLSAVISFLLWTYLDRILDKETKAVLGANKDMLFRK